MLLYLFFIQFVTLQILKFTFFSLVGFLSKPFSYMTKNSEQKLKYLKNERSF